MSAPTTIPAADMAALVARQREQLADAQPLRDALAADHYEHDRVAYAEALVLVTRDLPVRTNANYPDWKPGMARAGRVIDNPGSAA